MIKKCLYLNNIHQKNPIYFFQYIFLTVHDSSVYIIKKGHSAYKMTFVLPENPEMSHNVEVKCEKCQL